MILPKQGEGDHYWCGNRPLAIVGTGGLAKELFCLAVDVLGSLARARELVYFCNERSRLPSSELLGACVLSLEDMDHQNFDFIVGIGDPFLRARVVESLLRVPFATLVHPSSRISPFVTLGDGCVVSAGVTLTCEITVGRHGILDRHSCVGHDSHLGDFVTLAPGSVVSGRCNVGTLSYIGANACLRQGISIAPESTIGMGAVVVKSLHDTGVYVGSPARWLKPQEQIKL